MDATVITSPAEFAAEKQGLRVIMPARELGELVRIPITGIGATQKKIEKEPDEIVRLRRALRLATLYPLNKSRISPVGVPRNDARRRRDRTSVAFTNCLN